MPSAEPLPARSEPPNQSNQLFLYALGVIRIRYGRRSVTNQTTPCPRTSLSSTGWNPLSLQRTDAARSATAGSPVAPDTATRRDVDHALVFAIACSIRDPVGAGAKEHAAEQISWGPETGSGSHKGRLDGHLGQSAAVIRSVLYLLLRRLLGLLWSSERTGPETDLEIVVLRHQLAILCCQVKRPVYRRTDRAFLTAASRLLPRRMWHSFMVRPETLLRWHRELVAKEVDQTSPAARQTGDLSRGQDPGSAPRPGRIRGGGTIGSRANSSAWASLSRPPRSPRSFGGRDSAPLLGEDRPGASSFDPRPPGSSPATSSPSRRCC